MKRYLFWGASLLAILGLTVFAIRSDMVPVSYLTVAILALSLVYCLLFLLQKKWRKGRFAIAACVEMILLVIAVYGISIFYHAESLFKNITEIVVKRKAKKSRLSIRRNRSRWN